MTNTHIRNQSLEFKKALLQKLTEQGLLEWTITPKKFRHKVTGKIETQISIMEMSNYEESK